MFGGEMELDMDDLFDEEPLEDVLNDNQNNEREEEEKDHEESEEKGEEEKDKKKPKRIIKNPRPKLDPERLCGPRGIATMEKFFQDIKFKGKGYEKEDFDALMKKMEHWAHRLMPSLTFDDCLEKIAKVGVKKAVQANMTKIRNGWLTLHEEYQKDATNADEETENVQGNDEDVFNQLIREQDEKNDVPTLNEEQKARMLRSRLEAQEKRRQRLIDLSATNQLSNISGEMEGEGLVNKSMTQSSPKENFKENMDPNSRWKSSQDGEEIMEDTDWEEDFGKTDTAIKRNYGIDDLIGMIDVDD